MLGAAATRAEPGAGGTRSAEGAIRRALPSAVLLSAHTLALTVVSRRETTGGTPLPPLAALVTTGVLAHLLVPERPAGARRPEGVSARDGAPPTGLRPALRAALALAYAATAARPYFHAVLNPSPALTQRAVAGGIRATIPLQAALSARAGAPVTALLTAALAPLAAKFARKVSVT
jgi:4-hydroxybenzoate polyprenyltransferase